MSRPLTVPEAINLMDDLCYGNACDSCGGLNEPYMLKHELWSRVAKGNPKACICLSCVERKIKRSLVDGDFLDAPINNGCFAFHKDNWLNATDYTDFLRLTRDFLEVKYGKEYA